MGMFGKIFSDFSFATLKSGAILKIGMDLHDFIIVAVVINVLFVISLLQEKGIKLSEVYAKQHIVVRYAILYALILSIIIFGAYGRGYVPVDPMYAEF